MATLPTYGLFMVICEVDKTGKKQAVRHFFLPSREKSVILQTEIMIRKILITLLLLVPLYSQAQYVRLFGKPTETALYVDLDHVWSYNLYEASRWGLGARLAIHPEILGRRATYIDGYVGYGLRDTKWKGGLGIKLPITKKSTVNVSVRRDYEKAASRSLSSYNITNISSLSAFVTRRLCDHLEAIVGYTYGGRWTLGAEGRIYMGHRLFEGGTLLYAVDGDKLPREDGAVLRLSASDKHGFTAEVILGATWPEVKPVARALAQYDKTSKRKALTTTLFLQGGLTAPGTPYTYMFDLGGTYGAPICFNHTLQTALPNEFTANLFMFVGAKVATTKPLWNFDLREVQLGSHPVPFVQLTAAWGTLWGQDGNGQLFYEWLPLQAPNMGIAEPAAGIEGLLRWGLTDWGIAAAYRLTPPQAPYARLDTRSNLTLLLTAKLIF